MRTSADLVSLDEPPFDRLKFVDLPCPTSKWQALKTLPRHVLQYWRAIGPARIVHVGFGGWPIIQAWLAVPLAKLRGKFVLANVESSPWRASVPGLPWHKRLQGLSGRMPDALLPSLVRYTSFHIKILFARIVAPAISPGVCDPRDLAE